MESVSAVPERRGGLPSPLTVLCSVRHTLTRLTLAANPLVDLRRTPTQIILRRRGRHVHTRSRPCETVSRSPRATALCSGPF